MNSSFVKIFFLIFSAWLSNVFFSSAETTTSVRQKISFNNDWKFTLGDHSNYKDTSFVDTDWRKLDLPHDWSIESAADEQSGGYGGFFQVGTGWYRKVFTVPETMVGKKVVIQFDGIYMNSEVWINNHFLGRYPYGYTTFQYDITEYLKTGVNDKNIIAVKVDNSLINSTRWYNGSGIYRNVWLIATRFIHFHNYKGVFVSTPKANSEIASLDIKYNLGVHFFPENEFQAFKKKLYYPKRMSGNLILKTSVIDPKGKVIAVSSQDIEVSDLTPSLNLTANMQVLKPALWSVQTPVLHHLRSEIIYKGDVIDDQITPFGIRELEYIPHKGMFVNGKSVEMKGVCLHHDAGSFGAAVPVEVWHRRLLKLKAMGCNAIRTSHNPAAPELYDLCDTLGFYVFDEAFDEWTRNWFYNSTENTRGKAENGYHLYFNQWAETDLRAMVQRDRNHPSVVLYGVGNEIPDQKEFSASVGKTISRLISYCHEEDPTRPVTGGCNPENTPEGNGYVDAMDISGFNYIERVHKDKLYLGEYEKRPEKLLVGTETSFTINHFLSYRDNDFAIGEFIWTGIDYLGESRRYPIRGFHADIMDLASFEKPDYYMRKAMWTDEPVVRLSIAPYERTRNGWRAGAGESKWNWQTGDSLHVFVYSNCDEVELLLNGKSLGKKPISKNLYHATWLLNFKAGTLKAIAYKNKKKVVEHVLSTASEAVDFDIHYTKSFSNSNGKEISFIEIEVIDKKGNVVSDYAEDITVKITGGAKLIGLDSGDLNYTGLFKTNTRKPYRGRISATLQHTDENSEVTIDIQSKGIHTTIVK